MVSDNLCGCDCGFNDVIRGREIGFAGTKSNNGTAGGFKGFSFGIDGQGRRLCDGGDSCGDSGLTHGGKSYIRGAKREFYLLGVAHLHFPVLALA